MKTFLLLALLAATCGVGSGCNRAPSAEKIGRYQLRVEDRAVIFDTETGCLYILGTNGTFVVRDPVKETAKAH